MPQGTRPASRLPRVELAPGYDVPPLLNGGWQLSGGHSSRPVERRSTLAALARLAAAGLTTFDCADIYTGVEALLGELLAGWRGPRLAIHTKLVPDLGLLPRLARRHVEALVDRSLTRLGVERLDLVQLHWWDYATPGYVEAAGWLSDLRAAGKVRFVGVTNFDVPRLREILDAGVPVLTHQVQCSLLDRRALAGMAELCRARGVHLLAYGALGGGFLSGRWLGAPEPVAPLANRSLVKYRLIIDELGGWPLFQELLSTLAGIAGRHRVEIATVALRWVLDRPEVAAVVVGAPDDRHLESNLRCLELRLDATDHARIDEVLGRASGPRGEVYALERESGSRHAAIMRYDLSRLEAV